MAASALFDKGQLPQVIARRGDQVFHVAVKARGGLFIVFTEELPAMDAFAVYLELLGMTLGAEFGDHRFACR